MMEMVLVAAVAFISGLLLREFLPGYMREKGKNLATKEDVTEITKKIEGVRHGYSAEIERLRVGLLRQQRTTERSLDWCEKMVYELTEYGGAFYALLGGMREGYKEKEQAPYWSEIQARAEGIHKLAPGAGLFSPSKAVRLVEALSAEFASLGASREPLKEGSGVRRYDISVDRVEAHLVRVKAAIAALTEYHRAELGLESLPPREESPSS